MYGPYHTDWWSISSALDSSKWRVGYHPGKLRAKPPEVSRGLEIKIGVLLKIPGIRSMLFNKSTARQFLCIP